MKAASAPQPDAVDHSKLHHLLRRGSHSIMNKLHHSPPNKIHTTNLQASSGSSTSLESSDATKSPILVPQPIIRASNPAKSLRSLSISRRSTTILPKSNNTTSSSSASDIFERSLNNSLAIVSTSTIASDNKHAGGHGGRAYSIASNSSSVSNYTPSAYSIPSHHSIEDYIAPVLDLTAEILTDPALDYKNVQIVCCCDEDDDEEAEEPVDSNPFNRRKSLPNIYKSRSNSRTRSRSRSIIGNSLLHSFSASPTSPSSPTGLSRSSKSTTSLYSRAPSSPTPAHPHHLFHSATTDHPLISSKLQAHYGQHPHSPTKTIDFYSFADICNSEQLSSSPPRNHSSIDDKLSDDDSHIISKLNDYSINNESTYSQPTHLDTKADKQLSSNSSSTSLASPAGFTSMSMKDYMSNLSQ